MVLVMRMVMVIMVLVMRCGEGGQGHPCRVDYLSNDYEDGKDHLMIIAKRLW